MITYLVMDKLSVKLIALAGLTGVVILIISFMINTGPGPNPTVSELTRFGREHYTSIMIGSWMQAVSPPLIVTFALGLVSISGNNGTLYGSLTFLGGLILLIVSMMEVALYFSALTGTPATTGMISIELIPSVQRLYSIIAAPFFFFALSSLILRSNVLPLIMGYIGFLLGAVFFVMGILELFFSVQNIVDIVAMVQGLWWLIASILVLLNAGKFARRA